MEKIMPIGEIQTEVKDDVSRTTEHFNGTATTTPTPITTSTNRPIQLLELYVPTKGPNANAVGAVLLVSWDGTNYMSYPRGSSEMWPGKGYGANENTISVKSYSGSVKYEIKVIS